ncbi:hypothetical protein ABPG77_006267 [Micractinium sp. CCAP 211/92]
MVASCSAVGGAARPAAQRRASTTLLVAPCQPAAKCCGSSSPPRAPRPLRQRSHLPSAIARAPAEVLDAAAGSDRFDRRDWDAFLSGYKSQYEERAYWIDDNMVEGTIPAELEGTLLRNGPGLFEVGGVKIPQPFDGDGLLAIFAFKGGRAFFANRYVRTKGFVQEQQARRLLYRGAFSVGNPAGGLFYNPFDLSVKGIANTGVVHWAGKLLALYERDLPYELSTPELRTKGQTVTVPSQAPYFGAHYRITQEADGSRRLVAFNAAEVGQDNRINLFEYDEGMRLLHRTETELPGAAFGFFHDFLVTPNYYIFLESPMSLDLWKMATQYMFGKACIAECIVWDEKKKTKVHLIPRPGAAPGAQRRTIETAPFFSFHHGNAFEAALPSGAPAIVLDTVANHDGVDLSANFETGPTYYDDNVGRGTLTRLVLDLRAGTAAQHRLMDRACEFPSVAPSVTGKPHRHVYLAGSRFPSADAWGPPQVVCKVSLAPEAGLTQPCGAQSAQQDVYTPGRGSFAQEPIFVPRPGAEAEDDGWVLALVYDSAKDRTRLVILDAHDLAAGPVATIKLPHMLPFGLHGSWTGAYLGPQPEQPFQPTLYDIRQGVELEHAA